MEGVSVLFRCLNFKHQLYKNSNLLLQKTSLANSTVIPSRTTMIVKRPFPPGLYKEGNKPRLQGRSFYYDLVENTDIRPEPLIDIVLTSHVKGVGNDGDIVRMKRWAAYNKLLVVGLADYATPEMLEYSKRLKADVKVQEKLMSPSVEMCINFLQKTCIPIEMNQNNEWTIEPWHVRVSARKVGIHILSDDSIELPARPITGPDLSLEKKDFFVTFTINKKHKTKVRCRLFHWTAVPSEKLLRDPEWWLTPGELIFPDDEAPPPTKV